MRVASPSVASSVPSCLLHQVKEKAKAAVVKLREDLDASLKKAQSLEDELQHVKAGQAASQQQVHARVVLNGLGQAIVHPLPQH